MRHSDYLSRSSHLLVALLLPVDAVALSWQELWQTADQQGQNAFQEQQYEQAAAKFQQNDWKAAAQYKAGDYQQALEALENTASSDGFYNKGNAYTKLGKLQEALTAYQQALELDPDNKDAQFNKELIEKELEKQQQQSEQDNSQEQDQDQQQQQQDGEQDQQNSSDQQQSQQQKDQQAESQQQEEGDGQSEPSTNQGEQETHENEDAADEQSSAQQDEQQNTEQEELPAESEQAAASAQDETEQASEQWLKRIPDDPAGLLKRKFAYQYKQRQRNASPQSEQW